MRDQMCSLEVNTCSGVGKVTHQIHDLVCSWCSLQEAREFYPYTFVTFGFSWELLCYTDKLMPLSMPEECHIGLNIG